MFGMSTIEIYGIDLRTLFMTAWKVVLREGVNASGSATMLYSTEATLKNMLSIGSYYICWTTLSYSVVAEEPQKGTGHKS